MLVIYHVHTVAQCIGLPFGIISSLENYTKSYHLKNIDNTFTLSKGDFKQINVSETLNHYVNVVNIEIGNNPVWSIFATMNEQLFFLFPTCLPG